MRRAVREQCWLAHCGEVFKTKCAVTWCKNEITVFDFHVGHNTPKSKGGPDSIANLKPICARCNTSMSNSFTIDEWNRAYLRSGFSDHLKGIDDGLNQEERRRQWKGVTQSAIH